MMFVLIFIILETIVIIIIIIIMSIKKSFILYLLKFIWKKKIMDAFKICWWCQTVVNFIRKILPRKPQFSFFTKGLK